MHVTIRFFASHREATGRASVVADVPDESTVAEVFARVSADYPAVTLTGRGVAFALNHEHVPGDAKVRDGDEIAILPPVAGG